MQCELKYIPSISDKKLQINALMHGGNKKVTHA